MTDTSATRIDLVLTNVKENIHASGVIHLGISDHSLIYAVRKFMLPKTNPAVREIRDYKHFDAELFVETYPECLGTRFNNSITPTHVGMCGNPFLLRH